MGLATHLQLADLGELQLQGWSDEALATAQIEGEMLQVSSVRASAARRLGLSDGKKIKRDARADPSAKGRVTRHGEARNGGLKKN